jgi:hypothetical protein
MDTTYGSELNRAAKNFDLHQHWFDNLKSQILYHPFHSNNQQSMIVLFTLINTNSRKEKTRLSTLSTVSSSEC